MELIQVIGCYDACKKLDLPKAAKTLEKIINIVSKQLLSQVETVKTKTPSTKEIKNETSEAVTETQEN